MIERGNPLLKVTKFGDKTLKTNRLGLFWTGKESKSSLIFKRRSKKHEFQADYDRRSIQKLSETIESQQEELHRAQAEERRRQDHQLLHEQLMKQNWDLREGHEKSLNEMEEVKKFQGSTFDTFPPHPVPGGLLSRSFGMPSRKDGPPSLWDTAWYIGKRFCRSSCVLYSTLSAGIESMEFRDIRTDSLINGGEE